MPEGGGRGGCGRGPDRATEGSPPVTSTPGRGRAPGSVQSVGVSVVVAPSRNEPMKIVFGALRGGLNVARQNVKTLPPRRKLFT